MRGKMRSCRGEMGWSLVYGEKDLSCDERLELPLGPEYGG